MGYILKTNKRKRISGSTLKAKIVSPDKQDVVYREYPVQVQIQTLSDRECVLRDMQQLDSILSQYNNWANITGKINELSTALQSASNGSKFILQPFQPDGDDQGKIVDSEGTILRQPIYAPNQTNTEFSSTLKIIVKKGSVQEEYIKEFVVPAYTADQIIAKIKTDFWYNSNLWTLIKGQNDKPSQLHANLTKIVSDTILANNDIDDMFDTTDPTAKPTLTMHFPSYHTDPLVANDEISISEIEASTMYQLKDNTNYRIEDVIISDLSETECTHLGITRANSKGEIIAYRMFSSNSDDNVIYGDFTLAGSSLPCTAKVSEVGFLSKKISTDDIKNNIASSSRLAWFIPTNCISAYGGSITNDTAVNDSSNAASRKHITIPKDSTTNKPKNPVIKIASSLESLVTNDVANNKILDAAHIGYEYDPSTGVKKGFGGLNMISVKLTLSNGAEMHVTNSPVDPSADLSSNAAVDPLVSRIDNPGEPKYLYLDGRTEFTSSIEGVITIELLQTALDGAKTVLSFFFSLDPATS